MKEFPTPIQRGKYRKYNLSKEQKQWIKDNYGTHTIAEMAGSAGISDTSMSRIVRGMKLTRTDEQQAYIERQRTERLVLSQAGYYASRRGRKMSEACIAGHRKYIEEIGVWQKRASEAQIKEWRTRLTTGHRKGLERDKKRLKLGLKPLSFKLKENPYNKYERGIRKRALMRNYLIGDNNGDEYERHSLFYDSETERSILFEKHAITRGFFVRPA